MALSLRNWLLPFEVGDGFQGLPFGMLGRKFESHQLPKEFFYFWDMNPKNLGSSMPQLGRFWVVPMQSSFLKPAKSKFVRGLKITISNYQLPEIKRQNYN